MASKPGRVLTYGSRSNTETLKSSMASFYFNYHPFFSQFSAILFEVQAKDLRALDLKASSS